MWPSFAGFPLIQRMSLSQALSLAILVLSIFLWRKMRRA